MYIYLEHIRGMGPPDKFIYPYSDKNLDRQKKVGSGSGGTGLGEAHSGTGDVAVFGLDLVLYLFDRLEVLDRLDTKLVRRVLTELSVQFMSCISLFSREKRQRDREMTHSATTSDQGCVCSAEAVTI